jgi:ubiquinone/menaquinone biosynthesis C-methylase UbiE
MSEGKPVLDACCGSKMFWFNKKNPDVLFVDIRNESHRLCDGRNLEINPDTQADFRALPFPDESFYHVVFDPPHLKQLGESSWMAKKYGVLSKDWQTDIKSGFDECMRVLKPYGTLIFKWNEDQIKIPELIKVIGSEPLYGHTTRRNSATVWMCFMKLV